MTQAQTSALLSAVFDAAVDAIIVATKDGIITRANAAANRLFGYDGTDLLGQNIGVLMPPDQSGNHDVFMQNHMASGIHRIVGTERPVEGLRRDGTVFPLQISVGRADYDGTTAFIAVLHDLTDRRAAQHALARSQRLDAIGQMTVGIAHDFNNLLTVILGNLELAADHINNDNARAMIDDALEAAEMGADLTQRLTQFARQSYLQPQVADITAACRSAKAMLDRIIGSNYTIIFDPAPEMPEAVVDPAKFQTAVMNLALNARDAMPQGGQITISSAVVQIDDDYVAQEIDIKRGTYIRVSVSDTGSGMSAEAQLRAFEPFYTTKPLGKGTGLGLAMVHGFARQSHGHVTLYSEIGHGSTFSLYLPIATDTAVNTGPGAGNINLLGHNQRVLVVEDNAKVRSLTCERIAALGYRALAAETADRALEILNAGYNIDVLFTDLVMPGSRGGFELALLVRSNFPSIKIILTTGYAKETLNRNNHLDKPFRVLSKPYRQEDLALGLHAALAAR